MRTQSIHQAACYNSQMQVPITIPTKAQQMDSHLLLELGFKRGIYEFLFLYLNHSSVQLETGTNQSKDQTESNSPQCQLYNCDNILDIMDNSFSHMHVHLIWKRKHWREHISFSTTNKKNQQTQNFAQLRNITHKNSFHYVNMVDGSIRHEKSSTCKSRPKALQVQFHLYISLIFL